MIYYFEGKFVVAYLLLCLIALLYAIIKRKQDRAVFAVLGGVLCLYLFFVIKMTQFPIYTGEIFAEDLSGQFWKSINLIPFKGSFNFGSIQNIILTAPLGFVLPLILPKKTSLKQIALIGVCTGIMIEALQLAQLLVNTFTFRVIDINDVFFNCVGVLLGFGCYKAMRAIILGVCFSRGPDLGNNKIASYFETR